MDESTRSEALLALGRRLVDELGLEPSTDTLGRWMAHYIADLITDAEGATGKTKRLAEKTCFKAVLALWKHRVELPNGKRPFQGLEPVLRAVESLDPDNKTPRYFLTPRSPKSEGAESAEAEKWLEKASDLDYSAKILVGFCLAEAASAAMDKSKEWVKLAEAAGVEEGVPEIVIRFLSAAPDLQREPDIHGELRRRLRERLKRLEGFTKLAEEFAGHLRARIEALPQPEKADDDPEDKIVLSAEPPFG